MIKEGDFVLYQELILENHGKLWKIMEVSKISEDGNTFIDKEGKSRLVYRIRKIYDKKVKSLVDFEGYDEEKIAENDSHIIGGNK